MKTGNDYARKLSSKGPEELEKFESEFKRMDKRR